VQHFAIFHGKIKIGCFAALKYRHVNIVRIIGREKRTKDGNPLDFFRPGQASDDVLTLWPLYPDGSYGILFLIHPYDLKILNMIRHVNGNRFK